jgi:hypothetical protein
LKGKEKIIDSKKEVIKNGKKHVYSFQRKGG